MKRQALVLFLLVSISGLVSGQTAIRVSTAEASIRKDVAYLTADKLAGRRTGEKGANEAAKYIVEQFKKAGLRPGFKSKKSTYLQEFSVTRKDAPTVSGFNVVGVLPGLDPKLKDEAIVIGAHYDHLGRGGAGSLAINSKEIHHGADDNASGTSAMIELARQFVKAKKNKRTIIFIAFSGEEEGLFGSKFYVNDPIVPVENTVAMINMDMVGRLKDNKLNIGGIGTATEWKSLVEASNINQAAVIPASNGQTNIKTDVPFLKKFDLALNDDGFGPSDHSSFYTKKIPVLFFFTGSHLDYHKPTDTAEKINYNGLMNILGMVSELAWSIDQNPVRPTYAVAKSTQMVGGRSGSGVSLGTIPSYTESTDGMVIDGVRDDSPASKAGLKANDKIVKLAGVEIKGIQDYMKALGEMKPGDEYDIDVVRSGERISLKIVPAKR